MLLHSGILCRIADADVGSGFLGSGTAGLINSTTLVARPLANVSSFSLVVGAFLNLHGSRFLRPTGTASFCMLARSNPRFRDRIINPSA